jgi:hypothetical protein
VNNLKSKRPARPQTNPDAERRKVGRVVHDDRGNASVDWRDAPADYDRPVLEVLDVPGLSIKSEESCDPYAHRDARSAGAGGSRTDLRKLSEWIKMMREREQRKRRSGGEGEAGG